MRALLSLGFVALVLAAIGGANASPAQGSRVRVGDRLSILVPAGWRVSHKRFTPCSNPVERFSLLGSGQILTVEEEIGPVGAELTRRPEHFSVRGKPSPMECCAIPGRNGWTVQFSDHGRAFYAYLYPGSGAPRTLLKALDSLRVG